MQIKEHTVKSYDKDLESIAKTIKDLLELLKTSILIVRDVIENPKQNLVQKISDQDFKINHLDHLVEQKVTAMLALRQPKAFDLRYVVTALKASSNIERMGDKCKSIVKKVAHLDTEIDESTRSSLLQMLNITTKMAEDAIICFNDQDEKKADRVLKQDDEIDDIYESLLINAEEGNVSADKIKNIVNILFIAKSFERMADHATNIAELTKYVISGKIVE
jgi:phosphate transport system protein